MLEYILWPLEVLGVRFQQRLYSLFSGGPDAGLIPLPHVERLSPAVVRVLGLNPGKYTLQGTNTYVVGAGPKRLLVDTGVGMAGYLPLLESALLLAGHEEDEEGDEDEGEGGEEEGEDREGGGRGTRGGGGSPRWAGSSDSNSALGGCVTPLSSISSVIITHRHMDHVGGLPALLAAAPHLRVYKYLAPGEAAAIPGAPEHEYLPMADGQSFVLPCGTTLTCHYFPGHSPDHCCLWLEEPPAVAAAEAAVGGCGGGLALLSGDNVLGQGSAVFERLGPYMDSLDGMMRLVERHAAQTGVHDVPLYPGHGPVVTAGRAKIAAYMNHRRERERQILRALELAAAGTAGHTYTAQMPASYPSSSLDVSSCSSSLLAAHCRWGGAAAGAAGEPVEATAAAAAAAPAAVAASAASPAVAVAAPAAAAAAEQQRGSAGNTAAAATGWRDIWQVVHSVYGSLPFGVRRAAAWSAFQHLDKLEAEGVVLRRGGERQMRAYWNRFGGGACGHCDAAAAGGSESAELSLVERWRLLGTGMQWALVPAFDPPTG